MYPEVDNLLTQIQKSRARQKRVNDILWAVLLGLGISLVVYKFFFH